MALSSPNEPTEGPGGMDVYDIDGLHVGRVHRDLEPESLSEDLARVVIRLDPATRESLALRAEEIDVEATWLEAPSRGDHLVMDRSLREALVEQGFDL